MTQSVVANGYGGPENLELIEEPGGRPGPDEVVVTLRAIGVNPIDYKKYSGAFGDDPSALPIHLGEEGAGVVTDVADGVAGPTGPIARGDAVVVYPYTGTYADTVVVPASSVLGKPDGVSFEDAAGLLLVGVTAYDLLQTTGVGADDTVVIHGGAGAVGTIATQLAVVAGATVVATARPENHEVLRGLGAIPVSYGDGLLERLRDAIPGGYTVALDTVGTDEAIDTSLELVGDRTRIASIAAFGRASDGIVILDGSGDSSKHNRDVARKQLLDQLANGELTVTTAKEFSLADAADAHRELKQTHPRGKFILTP
ncbi:NADP-dependent oxidoreductase [Williamsia sterculiae]|uniref:NADPH:quinone reductase n=1 Tax=Williamsia sterculiae TaxID=1344003 RepID=A0A1N7F4I9_9NOCA|nr:NADP-dependent oxidoreductase [Williamsia sterculiae]SIR95206.1 NADPH:quinone reductase [Williamsia sterculiae]